MTVLLFSACSDDKKGGGGDSEGKLAGLCVEATKQLAENSSDVDGETFMQMIQNALQACSGGCDEGDDESCENLEDHLTKVCKVKGELCSTLCESADSPSLKKYSCKVAEAGG